MSHKKNLIDYDELDRLLDEELRLQRLIIKEALLLVEQYKRIKELEAKL